MKKVGIHHITAVASDPQRNYDFYTQLLGLRFVKKTVNFDDPSAYHFYFGDKAGSPGSILTFFPHPGLPRGQAGMGQAVETVFAIPKTSFSFWLDRFHQKGIAYQGPEERFGDKVLRITDPDGLMLEFVGTDDLSDDQVWATSDVPAEHAIRGFHSVVLWVQDHEKTAALLNDHLGFKLVGQEDSRYRFSTGEKGLGQIVDLRALGNIWQGKPGAGTIHHVAWRCGDDAQQDQLRQALLHDGYGVTPVRDRNYFNSIYFREANGIIFEIATEEPGFAVDENPETLGHDLKLPQQYEPHREAITAALPKLDQAA